MGNIVGLEWMLGIEVLSKGGLENIEQLFRLTLAQGKRLMYL